MIKFFRLIPYHIKTAFHSLIRHTAMTFSSSSTVAIALTLLMVFLVASSNISNFTHNIEKSLMIHATIESNVHDEELQQLQEKIEKLDHVVKVTYSNKDDELNSYLNNVDEASRKLYDTYQGEGNPLLDAFQVEVDKGESMEIVSKQLNKMDGIVESNFGGDSASMIVKAMDGIRYTGGIFVIALSLLAVFLISNTIKSAIYSRNNEIAIMRNVGATNGFIKLPFMIEGMFIGILGSVIPMCMTYFGYSYLYQTMNGVFLLPMLELQPIYPFVMQVSLALLVTGMIVGIMGSFFAVNKYLKWKR